MYLFRTLTPEIRRDINPVSLPFSPIVALGRVEGGGGRGGGGGSVGTISDGGWQPYNATLISLSAPTKSSGLHYVIIII